jgi:hypothetical protein
VREADGQALFVVIVDQGGRTNPKITSASDDEIEIDAWFALQRRFPRPGK